MAWVKKWVEKKRVLQFLRGLNPKFEGRRAALFHQANLPSLEEAIAAMAQEETRLKVIKGNTLIHQVQLMWLRGPKRPEFVIIVVKRDI